QPFATESEVVASKDMGGVGCMPYGTYINKVHHFLTSLSPISNSNNNLLRSHLIS
ncbi:unnamed protein product, partial [Sphenostylis stenocarpa]